MAVQTVIINGQAVLVEVVPATVDDQLPAATAPARGPGRDQVD